MCVNVVVLGYVVLLGMDVYLLWMVDIICSMLLMVLFGCFVIEVEVLLVIVYLFLEVVGFIIGMMLCVDGGWLNVWFGVLMLVLCYGVVLFNGFYLVVMFKVL